MFNLIPANGTMTIEAGQIIVWVLVFVRTGAFFMGIPLFAGKMLAYENKNSIWSYSCL